MLQRRRLARGRAPARKVSTRRVPKAGTRILHGLRARALLELHRWTQRTVRSQSSQSDRQANPRRKRSRRSRNRQTRHLERSGRQTGSKIACGRTTLLRLQRNEEGSQIHRRPLPDGVEAMQIQTATKTFLRSTCLRYPSSCERLDVAHLSSRRNWQSCGSACSNRNIVRWQLPLSSRRVEQC